MTANQVDEVRDDVAAVVQRATDAMAAIASWDQRQVDALVTAVGWALLIEGAMYALNPDPAFLPTTSNDHHLKRGAAYSLTFEEFFDLAGRGDVDRMFVSGGQIDRYGNTNVTAIGSIRQPKVKLGGGGGGCNITATIKRLTLWTTHHRTGRTLVDECDFLTDIGHRTPTGTRAELGYPGGGPQWLVTDLGIFDFDPTGCARLCHLFPDVTLAETREATGFAFAVADDLRSVPPPGAAELAVVRSIDPLGIRRSEFDDGDLGRTFDHEANRSGCGC